MSHRFLCLPLLVLVACQTPPARNTASPGDSSPATQQLVQAICDLAERCTSGLEVNEPNTCGTVAMNVAGQRLSPMDLDTLQYGPPSSSFDTLRALQDSIDAGRAAANREQLASCMRAIRALPCSAIPTRFTQLAECAAVFAGTVPQGGHCNSTPACVSGTICVPGSGEAMVCEGTCQPIGTVCRDDDDCDATRSCSSGTCQPTRTPAGGEEQPCGSSFSLYTDTRCQPGLVCSNFDSTGTCERPHGVGEACWSTANCEAGLDCKVVGDMPGACATQVSVAEGGTCYPFQSLCAPGLRCLSGGMSATCLKVKGKGETCQLADECGRPKSGLVCDFHSHTCVEEPTSGPCPAPNLPFGGCDGRTSYCNDELKCEPFLALGATCHSGDECGQPALARYCNPGESGGSCTEWPAMQRCLP